LRLYRTPKECQY